MSKVGRNEPCPCGSGLKYKKCCESKDVGAAVERARAHAAAAAERLADTKLPRTPASYVWEDDGLDELSNSVIDLIRGKRFDDALAACERLRTEFPEVHDWLERSAMVHEARGDFATALDFYRRHIAFITAPARRDGYDEELIEMFRSKVTEMESKLTAIKR